MMERRLAAILAADVVGYSRLMGKDEAATLAALKACETGLIEPTVAANKGRIVKRMGDGFLVEFASAVDAVQCALDWQAAPQSPDRVPLKFRIGVNLGDIIYQDGDIYGDGVNVAARLEGLAETGGVCIAASVHDQIRRRIDKQFHDLGEQGLKNIDEPIRVFGWWPAHGKVESSDDALKTAGLPSQSDEPRPEKDAAHPDKPSIAVLAFENMSGDPKQEYFSDGISEDIIAGLSRCRSLTVIARTSSFTYKQTSVDARQMSQELGVRYLVEGSVRHSGERLRVAVQLIDGQTAGNLWSERYDRELADIFAVQDEITASILGTLLPEIAAAEAVRLRRTPPNQLDAWALYHRGRDHTYKYSKEDNREARSLFKRAVETDNSFASAHAGLAFASFLAVHDDYSDHPQQCIEEGLKAAREAVRLDNRDEVAHMALGRILTLKKLYDEAVAASDASIELNPSYAPAHFGRAYALTLAGRAPESLASFETAISFSPRHPNLWAFQCVNAWAHIQCGNQEEANRLAVQASLHPNTNFWAPATLAATLAQLGKLDEAHNVLHQALVQKPDLSLTYIGETLPFRDNGVRDAIFGTLTGVGLPANSATWA